MKLGLVTQPKTYTGRIFLKSILGIAIKEEIKHPSNPFELKVGILPFSEAMLNRMPPRRLEKVIKKQQIRLKRCGVEKIVYSDFLKKICGEKTILKEYVDDNCGNILFLKLLPIFIRQTAEKIGIDLINATICIRDSKAGRISEYLMRELCFDTKNLEVCTRERVRFEAVCDRFYEETGLLVKVLDWDMVTADVCIDVDLLELRFGRDLFVRTIDMGFDLDGYVVRHRDIAACLDKFEPDKIKCCYSHKKNRLTLGND